MSESRLFVLAHDLARQRAAEACRAIEYEGWRVTMCPPLKSRPQEERYHAMCADIADQWKFCDRTWDRESMKCLLIDQFKRDTINDPDLAEEWRRIEPITLAPSIDGSGVVALGTQSRRFSKPIASAFIEWLFAFGAERDITWTNETERA